LRGQIDLPAPLADGRLRGVGIFAVVLKEHLDHFRFGARRDFRLHARAIRVRLARAFKILTEAHFLPFRAGAGRPIATAFADAYILSIG
jgi:hypothetical protein